MKEQLYRRGFWLGGMTRHGPKVRNAPVPDDDSPTQWEVHNIVMRMEEDEHGEDPLYLYKIVCVSPEHMHVSDDEHISYRIFRSTDDGTHKLTKGMWNNFKACELSSVPDTAFKVARGS